MASSALGCDFNRSMQHLISKYREEDVADEEIKPAKAAFRHQPKLIHHS
jgi:hypothetical protein